MLVRTEVGDDRLLGAPRTVTLALGAAARDEPILVRVFYERPEGPSTPTAAGSPAMGSVELFNARVPALP